MEHGTEKKERSGVAGRGGANNTDTVRERGETALCDFPFEYSQGEPNYQTIIIEMVTLPLRTAQ